MQVTTQVQPDEERRSGRFRVLQNRALELAAENRPLHAALNDLMLVVETQSSSSVKGSILLLDEQGSRLLQGAAPSLPYAYNTAIDGIAVGSGIGSCGTAAFQNRPVYVSDIAIDPLWANFRELALSHNLRACWSTPIVSAQGAVLGTFAMYYAEPREPSPGDLEIVDVVTRSAALMIERQRTGAALAASEERLRLAVDNADISFWDVDVIHDCLIWPPRTKAMFGISAEAPVTMQDFLKRTALPGGIETSAPVRGFRPIPVLRGFTLNTPKPRNSIRSPRSRAFFISSKTRSTAISALVFVSPVLFTTSLMMSSLINRPPKLSSQ